MDLALVRLGWSQYMMYECVGASQDGVVGGLGLRQDRLGCTMDPMIALRRANILMHVL